jgi:hypothetical protein
MKFVLKNNIFTHIYEKRDVISGDLHFMYNDEEKKLCIEN